MPSHPAARPAPANTIGGVTGVPSRRLEHEAEAEQDGGEGD